MCIAYRVMKISSSVGAECFASKHFAPTELEMVDERQAIHISLLRSYQTASSYVELTFYYTYLRTTLVA
jgi:hypothetical protein